MKRLRVILLFLLLGAVVNVAVAWGIAYFVNFNTFFHLGLGEHSGSGVTSETGACWLLNRADCFGSTRLTGDVILGAYRRKALLEDLPNVPAGSHFKDPPSMQMTMVEEYRGFPFLTLFWVNTFNVTDPTRRHVWIVRESPNEIYLPLAPIWGGMLFNTLFYATILWLFLTGAFAYNRMIRKIRRVCVKCEYDLRGTEHKVCPECGEEIRKANPA